MAIKLWRFVVAVWFLEQACTHFITIPRKPIILLPITQMPTPSMVDLQSWNFTKPSDFAKQCIHQLTGESVVSICQRQALQDWSSDRIGIIESTIWETCCAVYEEVDCYRINAHDFCPFTTGMAVKSYAIKVGTYFHDSICKSVSFTDWKSSCNNKTRVIQLQQHNSSNQNSNSEFKDEFISLPPPDGPQETGCISQSSSLIKQCMEKSLNKWDPNRHKLMNSTVLESCCATYESLDCIQNQVTSSSNSKGQCASILAEYQKKSYVVLGTTICKCIPPDQRDKLCKMNGNLQSGATSFLMTNLLILYSVVAMLFCFI